MQYRYLVQYSPEYSIENTGLDSRDFSIDLNYSSIPAIIKLRLLKGTSFLTLEALRLKYPLHVFYSM